MFRNGYGWLPEKRCVRLRIRFLVTPPEHMRRTVRLSTAETSTLTRPLP